MHYMVGGYINVAALPLNLAYMYQQVTSRDPNRALTLKIPHEGGAGTCTGKWYLPR